jgi:hypothetical protein
MAAQDFLAQRELGGRRRHSRRNSRDCAIAALEQAVEVRNVAKAGGEGDLRNRPATTRAIEQVSRADEDTLLVATPSARSRHSEDLSPTTLKRALFARADQPLAQSLLHFDDAETLRQRHRPRPLVYIKFSENVLRIRLHCLRRNPKATCNFLIGVPVSHQIDDMSLALT